MHFYEDTLSVWDGHVCFKSRFNAYCYGTKLLAQVARNRERGWIRLKAASCGRLSWGGIE